MQLGPPSAGGDPAGPDQTARRHWPAAASADRRSDHRDVDRHPRGSWSVAWPAKRSRQRPSEGRRRQAKGRRARNGTGPGPSPGPGPGGRARDRARARARARASVSPRHTFRTSLAGSRTRVSSRHLIGTAVRVRVHGSSVRVDGVMDHEGSVTGWCLTVTGRGARGGPPSTACARRRLRSRACRPGLRRTGPQRHPSR